MLVPRTAVRGGELLFPLKSDLMSAGRNLHIDLIKIVAMLLVIMYHTPADGVAYPFSFNLVSFCDHAACVPIPLFFMVCGYLLVPREGLGYGYVLRKTWHVVRFILAFLVVYELLFICVNGYADVPLLLECTWQSMIPRTHFGFLWFFGALVILYWLLPLVSWLYHRSEKGFAWFVLGLVVLNQVVFCNDLLNGLPSDSIAMPLRQYEWVLYASLGALVYRYRDQLHLGAVPALLMWFVADKFLRVLSPPLPTYIDMAYPALPVIASTAMLFVWLLHCKLPSPRLVKALNPTFLLVYVWHTTVLDFLSGWLRDSFAFRSYPLTFVMAAVLTVTGAWLLVKIPAVARFCKL